MTSKGKRYNQEFKSDILKLIQQEKRSVASIVTDFGSCFNLFSIFLESKSVVIFFVELLFDKGLPRF